LRRTLNANSLLLFSCRKVTAIVDKVNAKRLLRDFNSFGKTPQYTPVDASSTDGQGPASAGKLTITNACCAGLLCCQEFAVHSSKHVVSFLHICAPVGAMWEGDGRE
jgi:hypothetical protein